MSEENSPLCVVFDCMVYLQATISDAGPAATLLRLAENNTISLFVSSEIFDEVRDVLSRPKIRQKNLQLTDEYIDAFIRRISEKATVVKYVASHFTYSRDSKDEPYLNLAIEVQANYLISRDKDLLDLMTDYTDECKDFRRRFRFLKVIAPAEFLKVVPS